MSAGRARADEETFANLLVRQTVAQEQKDLALAGSKTQRSPPIGRLAVARFQPTNVRDEFLGEGHGPLQGQLATFLIKRVIALAAKVLARDLIRLPLRSPEQQNRRTHGRAPFPGGAEKHGCLLRSMREEENVGDSFQVPCEAPDFTHFASALQRLVPA